MRKSNWLEMTQLWAILASVPVIALHKIRCLTLWMRTS